MAGYLCAIFAFLRLKCAIKAFRAFPLCSDEWLVAGQLIKDVMHSCGRMMQLGAGSVQVADVSALLAAYKELALRYEALAGAVAARAGPAERRASAALGVAPLLGYGLGGITVAASAPPPSHGAAGAGPATAAAALAGGAGGTGTQAGAPAHASAEPAAGAGGAASGGPPAAEPAVGPAAELSAAGAGPPRAALPPLPPPPLPQAGGGGAGLQKHEAAPRDVPAKGEARLPSLGLPTQASGTSDALTSPSEAGTVQPERAPPPGSLRAASGSGAGAAQGPEAAGAGDAGHLAEEGGAAARAAGGDAGPASADRWTVGLGLEPEPASAAGGSAADAPGGPAAAALRPGDDLDRAAEAMLGRSDTGRRGAAGPEPGPAGARHAGCAAPPDDLSSSAAVGQLTPAGSTPALMPDGHPKAGAGAGHHAVDSALGTAGESGSDAAGPHRLLTSVEPGAAPAADPYGEYRKDRDRQLAGAEDAQGAALTVHRPVGSDPYEGWRVGTAAQLAGTEPPADGPAAAAVGAMTAVSESLI